MRRGHWWPLMGLCALVPLMGAMNPALARDSWSWDGSWCLVEMVDERFPQDIIIGSLNLARLDRESLAGDMHLRVPAAPEIDREPFGVAQYVSARLQPDGGMRIEGEVVGGARWGSDHFTLPPEPDKHGIYQGEGCYDPDIEPVLKQVPDGFCVAYRVKAGWCDLPAT